MHDLIYVFAAPLTGALSIFAWEKYQAWRLRKDDEFLKSLEYPKTAESIRDEIRHDIRYMSPERVAEFMGQQNPNRDTLRSIERGPYAESESPDESS